MRPLAAHQAQRDRRLSTSSISTDSNRNAVRVIHGADCRVSKRGVRNSNRASRDRAKIPHKSQTLDLLYFQPPRSHTTAVRPWAERSQMRPSGSDSPCSVAQRRYVPAAQRSRLHRQNRQVRKSLTPVGDQTEWSSCNWGGTIAGDKRVVGLIKSAFRVAKKSVCKK
jgi:hypothetical protein